MDVYENNTHTYCHRQLVENRTQLGFCNAPRKAIKSVSLRGAAKGVAGDLVAKHSETKIP